MSRSRPPSRKKTAPSPSASTELRPVGARALKSAIDTLRPYLYGARVLDLFAGQGRFGLSALHEGATFVVFVEKERSTFQNLKKEIVKESRAVAFCEDVFSFLERDPRKVFAGDLKDGFDLVIADPPFPLWENERLAKTLADGMVAQAAPDAILLVKHPSRMVLSAQLFPGYVLWKEKSFGESNLFFFRAESSLAPKN